MKKFTILKGIAAVMPDINIDTDNSVYLAPLAPAYY